MPDEYHKTPFDLPPHLDERTIALNDRHVDPMRGFVLCWLHHAVRAHENPALDVALTIGNDLGKPVLVYQGLGGNHRFNSDRHHVFIMEGARDLQRDLARRGIAYAFYLATKPGAPSPMRGLIDRACAVVTEDFPAPPFPDWSRAHAKRSDVAFLVTDSACLLPVGSLTKKHTRAFQFRDAAQDHWDGCIADAWTDVEPGVPAMATDDLGFEPVDLQHADLDTLAASCDIDHSIPAVRHTRGGSDAGYARWEGFKRQGLRKYANRRNNALDVDGVSRMSAYLHHGHVSPFRVAREAHAVGGKGGEKFLDELLTWRELSYHFAADSSTAQLETLEAIPGWAQETLEQHEGDEREALYTWETMSRARTGDHLWDGAQRSLLWSGELHNNLRMTWGKMIPQWTPDAGEALRLLIDLNHRYALDGNDPNSYGGLLWCLGQFDRPFKPGEPVLGTVRGRNTQIHAERLDPKKYNAVVRTHAAHDSLRVAVVGGGIAGLACARTLADQGCGVTVFDKGRGPGGRCATRFSDDDRFDHGSPWFDVTDPRFGRYVKSWIERGVAAVWKGDFAHAGPDGLQRITPDRSRVVGTPGMHALCAHLGDGLGVRHGERVTEIVREGDGFRVRIGDETVETLFDRVVVAVPPAQAVELLEGGMADRAGAIETSPRWSLMLTLTGEDAPFDALTFDGGPLEMIVGDDAKPGRERVAGRRRWVAHASSEWSTTHLEEDKQRVRDAMTELAREYLGADEAVHADAHRWRFAKTLAPIAERCLYEGSVAYCADGCGGAGVESAFLSGHAAAGRILASRAHAKTDQPEALFT
ncbi:MAG: FAD-dependent oxidoreductase [Planctomycetota bacterium]